MLLLKHMRKFVLSVLFGTDMLKSHALVGCHGNHVQQIRFSLVLAVTKGGTIILITHFHCFYIDLMVFSYS